MRYRYHLLFWLCCSRPFTVASPIHSISERYVDVDCHNQGSMFMSDCWTLLGISDWLAKWNQTTPVCSDSSRCCSADEPWSTCFLRLARGRGGQDCTTVDDQPCTWDNEVSEYLHPSIYDEVRYVVKSIYGVHDFFSSYFKALQYATTQTALMITPLTNVIDPNSDTMLGLNIMMFVLSFGLSFLLAPTVAVRLFDLSNSLRYAAQSFALSMQQAPAVARTMWPTGGETSRTFQISSLNTQLNNASMTLSETLDRALKLLMSDVPSFVSYAQSGNYCGNETVDIAIKTEGLDLALRTYVTSESMKQNGWYAVPLKISTEEEYQALVDAAPTAKGWRNGSDVVDKIWWSPTTWRQYSLEHDGTFTISSRDLMESIGNFGWANIPTLFDGSYNCTAAGRAGTAAKILPLFDGSLDVACISSLPIYRPCGSNCPDKLEDGSCPFGFKEDCGSPHSLPGVPPDRQQPGFVNPPP